MIVKIRLNPQESLFNLSTMYQNKKKGGVE
jgi:hypothetical protein